MTQASTAVSLDMRLPVDRRASASRMHDAIHPPQRQSRVTWRRCMSAEL